VGWDGAWGGAWAGTWGGFSESEGEPATVLPRTFTVAVSGAPAVEFTVEVDP